MRTIGFATSEEDPQLNDDDRLAFPALENLGISVVPVIWDGPESDNLKALDALVIRSCWNYHRKYPQFLSWLDHLKSLSIPVLNPVSTIVWNLNKKYLLELAMTFAVPKTKWIPSGTRFSKDIFVQSFSDWKSEKVVIKPAVSLNGHDTYLINKNYYSEIEPTISGLLENRDILIQEYIPEIQSCRAKSSSKK